MNRCVAHQRRRSVFKLRPTLSLSSKRRHACARAPDSLAVAMCAKSGGRGCGSSLLLAYNDCRDAWESSCSGAHNVIARTLPWTDMARPVEHGTAGSGKDEKRLFEQNGVVYFTAQTTDWQS
eukprot:1084836-Pleurochrysis_carterae.AAC.2